MNEQITFDNLNLDKAYKNYYIVPDYQREYVWKREEVEQLMSDITEAYLTAKDKDYLVFVEVKFRNTRMFGRASEAVDKRKQHKIRQVALLYLKQKRQLESNVRFDVVEVYDNEINHIENAF